MHVSVAAWPCLIALAVSTGSRKRQKKRNLTRLYETGAIDGDTLAACLKRYGLEAA